MEKWNARRKDTFQIIHGQFVDEDVVLQFPDIWNAEETKSKINPKLGDGFHFSLNYDLNNKSGINLPWDPKMNENIIKTTISSYNECMPGTGGGDGHNSSYVLWETHKGAECATYVSNTNRWTNNMASLQW